LERTRDGLVVTQSSERSQLGHERKLRSGRAQAALPLLRRRTPPAGARFGHVLVPGTSIPLGAPYERRCRSRAPSRRRLRLRTVPPIAELTEDRVVEGTFAVARKKRLRTRGGSPYLSLELVDPSGRIEARVWNDVELLDARFAEGDAVRVLGRVERFRDRLQLDVRAIEPAPAADPAAFAPAMRRDADELDGFLEFLAGEIRHPPL